MSNSNFRVGDKVRCVRGFGHYSLHEGSVYEVLRVTPHGDVVVSAEEGAVEWVRDRFERVESVPHAAKPCGPRRVCAVVRDLDGECYAQSFETCAGPELYAEVYDKARELACDLLAFDAGEQLLFGLSSEPDPGVARLDVDSVCWFGKLTVRHVEG